MSTDKDKNIVKPHYFELVMNSYSGGIMNQEIVIVREYAATGAQLTAKQMAFTRSAFPAIAQAVVDAMDEMSMPFQELGLEQMAEFFETVEGGRKPPGEGGKQPAGKGKVR
jgi:hypothetical protein